MKKHSIEKSSFWVENVENGMTTQVFCNISHSGIKYNIIDKNGTEIEIFQHASNEHLFCLEDTIKFKKIEILNNHYDQFMSRQRCTLFRKLKK